jgi:hypothetical protein
MTPALLLALLAALAVVLRRLSAIARAVARLEARKGDLDDILADAKRRALADLEAQTSAGRPTLQLVRPPPSEPSGEDEPTMYHPEGQR